MKPLKLMMSAFGSYAGEEVLATNILAIQGVNQMTDSMRIGAISAGFEL